MEEPKDELKRSEVPAANLDNKDYSPIQSWIRKKIFELLGMENEELAQFVIDELKCEKYPDPRRIHITLAGYFGNENARIFMSEVLKHLDAYENVNKFFLQEAQLAEELLGQEDIENGLEHLRLAVLVCGQPQSLLDVLQQTLTPQIFSLLLQKLDLAQEKIRSHVAALTGEKTREIKNKSLEIQEQNQSKTEKSIEIQEENQSKTGNITIYFFKRKIFVFNFIF